MRLSGDSELDEELLKLVPEYPLHLINLARLEHTEYFRTELRLLLELYKRKDDGEKWQKYIDSSAECRCMDEATYKLLEILAHVEGLDVEKNTKEEKVNMCKAIEDIKKKAREEGIERGIEQGREEGGERGVEEGIEQGIGRGIEQGVFQITCE